MLKQRANAGSPAIHSGPGTSAFTSSSEIQISAGERETDLIQCL